MGVLYFYVLFLFFHLRRHETPQSAYLPFKLVTLFSFTTDFSDSTNPSSSFFCQYSFIHFFVASFPGYLYMWLGRRLAEFLKANGAKIPLVHRYTAAKQEAYELALDLGIAVGALLIDGIGEGVCVGAAGDSDFDLNFLRTTSFGLLQGSRMRNTKTEFVSCPSCGRTLFDLQEVTAQISARTGHLPGVAIAIMGCIVNGPGEMADADFGYVGSLPGKVDLYVGKEIVRKGIPNEEACDALVDLIKANGKWVDVAVEEEELVAA